MRGIRIPTALGLCCAYLLALAPCPEPAMPAVVTPHASPAPKARPEARRPATQAAHAHSHGSHGGAHHDAAASEAEPHHGAHASASRAQDREAEPTTLRMPCACGCGDKARTAASGGRPGPALPGRDDAHAPPTFPRSFVASSPELLDEPGRQQDPIPI